MELSKESTEKFAARDEAQGARSTGTEGIYQ